VIEIPASIDNLAYQCFVLFAAVCVASGTNWIASATLTYWCSIDTMVIIDPPVLLSTFPRDRLCSCCRLGSFITKTNSKASVGVSPIARQSTYLVIIILQFDNPPTVTSRSRTDLLQQTTDFICNAACSHIDIVKIAKAFLVSLRGDCHYTVSRHLPCVCWSGDLHCCCFHNVEVCLAFSPLSSGARSRMVLAQGPQLARTICDRFKGVPKNNTVEHQHRF